MTPRRPGTAERVALWSLLLALAMLLVHGDWLWRLDRLLYDAQLRGWSREPAPNIVIVAIDEASLRRLGRWPWDRRLHAQLIDRLSAGAARATALDIIFAERSHDPRSDERLAAAMRANGRVILPVLAEQVRHGGQLVETLPIAPLAEVAAALGHVHVELDADGVARSVFLREGIGAPHWTNLGLTLLESARGRPLVPLPGDPNPAAPTDSPQVWVRDHRMFIPFAGPPGRFARISYAQVLDGDYPSDLFRDKLVLVGTTASGLGDALPTPVSGQNQPMPGVEINANIVDALQRGINLRALPQPWPFLLTAAIVLAPAFLFPRLTPRATLLTTLALIAGVIVLNLVLLRAAHLWFAPAVAVSMLVLSYPLWSWRRLEHAFRYLNRELARLHEEQAAAPRARAPAMGEGLEFLRAVLPLNGWALYRADGSRAASDGEFPQAPPARIPAGAWVRDAETLWTTIDDGNGELRLGLRWRDTAQIKTGYEALVGELRALTRHAPTPPRGAVELIQARIQQVQQATEQLRALRAFVSDTVAQMADGVLVVDALGTVTLSNAKAAAWLSHDDPVDLQRRPVLEILSRMELTGTEQWPALLHDALIAKRPVQAEARAPQGRDLLVQIAPLTSADRSHHGFIVNLSDISALKTSERKRAELLGFLSHDLRSPLVSLLALLELAKDRTAGAGLDEMLARMETYTRNTLDLAEEFLQLARAESAAETPFLEVDLVTVVLNAIEHVWTQAQQKHIGLEHRFTVDEAWIRADAGLLERAVINLINNAVKYSGEGTRVTITVEKADGEYRCCIADQGYGIPAQELPFIFDRFHRIDQPGQPQQRSAGLGLTLVKAVADRHGGRVEVESRVGAGSRFCLVLPFASV